MSLSGFIFDSMAEADHLKAALCTAATLLIGFSTELAKLNLEGFRSVPLNADDRMPPFANMLRHHMTLERIYSQVSEMRSFLEEHMEIAFDHSGRDLCISRQSGRIFFMDWTAYKEGPVEVASSFREFVQRFWNSHQGTVH